MAGGFIKTFFKGFLKVPRSGGEPVIFLIFVYFLSQAAP